MQGGPVTCLRTTSYEEGSLEFITNYVFTCHVIKAILAR